jgi:succinyl-diaminopimelate desuccinylase
MRALAESGAPLRRRFRLIAGLDEESGFRCVERYKRTEEIPEMSFSPDSLFPVVNGEKGILHFRLKREFPHDARGGNAPELLALSGGERYNMVPDMAEALFRRGGADETSELEETARGFGARTEMDGDSLRVVFRGKSAHAMEPWEGANAVQRLLAALSGVKFRPDGARLALANLAGLFKYETDGASLGVASSDDVSGALTCNLAAISSEGGELSVKCDIRYPVKVSGDFVISGIKRTAGEAGWDFEATNHHEPLYVPRGSALVRTLLDAYEAVTGEEPATLVVGGGTYCKAMPNSVSFGALFPGEEDTAHKPNEYVSIDSFKKMTLVYAEALARFNFS